MAQFHMRRMQSRGPLGKIVGVQADKETIASLHEEVKTVLDSLNVNMLFYDIFRCV
jgi:hypothetical protein